MNNSRFEFRVCWPMLTSVFVATMLSLGFVSTTTAQDAKPQAGGEGGLASRTMFVKKSQAQGKKVVALQYKLLALKTNAEGDVKFTPVDPRTYTFQIGDECRVEVTATTDCYLYVINQGPDGCRTVLLPDLEEKNQEPTWVKAGQTVRLPTGDDVFGFQLPVGEERLAVVAMKEKTADLEALVEKAFGAAAPDTGVNGIPITTRGDGDFARNLTDVRKDEKTKLKDGDAAFDGFDPKDGSLFAATVDKDNPEMVVSIPLRSRAVGAK